MSKGCYLALCEAAKRAGVRVELVTGIILHKARLDGVIVESRSIVELRLTHDSGRVVATEAMLGLGDRDNAAKALLDRVALLKS